MLPIFGGINKMRILAASSLISIIFLIGYVIAHQDARDKPIICAENGRLIENVYPAIEYSCEDGFKVVILD